MATFIVICCCLIWLASLALLFVRPIASPILSYLALLLLSVARIPGAVGDISYPLLPLNSTILLVWACMTVIVVVATVMQPDAIRTQNRGVGYMTGGAIVGLAVGLLGFTFSSALSLLYACMVVGVVAGVFFGYLLFTNTPSGSAVGLRSGRFFTYLPAKGFPIAITVMIPGVACVLALAISHNLL